jgi:hypothetical protein
MMSEQFVSTALVSEVESRRYDFLRMFGGQHDQKIHISVEVNDAARFHEMQQL